MGFLHIDHIGIVAHTIEAARSVLGDALGLELDEARSNWPHGSYFAPEQTTNYFFQVGGGETQVEVLIPDADATSGAARFLARKGPGMHHICYACEDVHVEAERLVGNGLREIDVPRGAGGLRTVAFFHPAGTGGILTELVPARANLRIHDPSSHGHGPGDHPGHRH